MKPERRRTLTVPFRLFSSQATLLLSWTEMFFAQVWVWELGSALRAFMPSYPNTFDPQSLVLVTGVSAVYHAFLRHGSVGRGGLRPIYTLRISVSTGVRSGMRDIKIVFHPCPSGSPRVCADPSVDIHVQPKICDHADRPLWKRTDCACTLTCVNGAMFRLN